MSAFDRVIGYKAIKEELKQICDMTNNRDMYEAMGARLPKGILLYGAPGVGKTLMTKCFIEESGLEAFVIRKNKGNGDFIELISDTFSKAKEKAPAIVVLDDLDKFANEDENHKNAPEYVAVQAEIDEVRDHDVFVMATANNIDILPESVIRAGRFDRKIAVDSPDEEDVSKIIDHYLFSKPISKEVDIDDLSKMFSFSSCAELETIINEAAISAVYKRKQNIEMDDLIEAVLKKEYNSQNDCAKTTEDELRKVALHEAGHLVISEVLDEGSVGLASICSGDSFSKEGFIHRCRKLKRRPHGILISLGGKSAVELYYSDTVASGCGSDLEKAVWDIRTAIASSGVCGLSFVDNPNPLRSSESLKARIEDAVRVELERYMYIARDILIKNKSFLEAATEALVRKKNLLYSDIQEIRKSCNIVPVSV